jgi:predicted nicotinamide N-methyase
MSSTKEWREVNIHDDDDDGGGEVDTLFNLFAEKDLYEIQEYEYSNTPKLFLRGQPEMPNSTGLALWLGSEVLCDRFVQNPLLIKDKRVLEMGAGMGLVGMVAHYLGASNVIMTDGATDVLGNLQYNMDKNLPKGSSVSCTQLIWGQDLEMFERKFGRQEVILAADVLYVTKTLKPFWETVRYLLDPDGLAIVLHRSSSQHEFSLTLETAAEYGFAWTCSNEEEGIYYFKRKETK